MKPHKVEIGERYADDSGWERRVMIDLQTGDLEIDIQGGHFSCHPREIPWLLQALSEALELTSGQP